VIHGLDELTIEAGFLRSATIFFLPPSGQRDDHRRLAPRLLSDPPAHVVTVQ
jgi:hypothetical protein